MGSGSKKEELKKEELKMGVEQKKIMQIMEEYASRLDIEEGDEEYSTLKWYAEYCIERHIAPSSFRAQLEYVLALDDFKDIADAIKVTILHNWKSISYATDNIRKKKHGGGKKGERYDPYARSTDKKKFTDTAQGQFKSNKQKAGAN